MSRLSTRSTIRETHTAEWQRTGAFELGLDLGLCAVDEIQRRTPRAAEHGNVLGCSQGCPRHVTRR